MTLDAAAREHLLAFADDEHMVGARHTNWIGLGPFLEEDLAFCSIAQDEIGHAIGLYEILLADDSAGSNSVATDLDAFAMLRDAADYRSCWLAEADCSDWSDSLVRHWLYDRAETLRWGALTECPAENVAALATRALREESFHLTHAESFMSRVVQADTSGHIAASIERLVPIARGVWDVPTSGDPVSSGFTSRSLAELAADWEALILGDLIRWGSDISLPVDDVTGAQAKRTIRSDGFDSFHAALQRVILLDTSAVW
jgi:ring-1,2-phenylacetyl-CoA epoxidase subunit PaaC